MPLAIILALVVMKHIPATEHLPLARTAGIVAFAYAGFLALRLIQGTDPVTIDGWSELRAAPVEYFGAVASGVMSAFLLYAVIVNGFIRVAPYGQMATGMALSILFALGCAAILFASILVKTRWNRAQVEHRSAFGKVTRIAWTEVTACKSTLRGITIRTAGRDRIIFSPFHSGAQSLARHAADHARKNAEAAQGAVADW